MKVVACVIARTVSTRLPLKVLRTIVNGYSLLDFLVTRLRSVSCIDEVYICTSTESVDDIMEDLAERNGVKLYRGSPTNVIERMLAVGEISNADLLLRITGDNPFTSTEFVENQVNFLSERNLDYVRLIDVPIGATAEVMTHNALRTCYANMDPSVSEYLMLYMFEPRNFRCGVIKPFAPDLSSYTVTVDTPEDLRRTRAILNSFSNGDPIEIKLSEIIEIIHREGIENATIKPSGTIKLPYGKTIGFDEFSNDMRRRIDASKQVKLYE